MRNPYLNTISLLLVLSFSTARGQISSGCAFLQGDFLEVGVAPCGAYGTFVAAPAGYHPNAPSSRLGFVADYGRDGWSVGTPAFYGDYLMGFGAGVQEGWALTCNGIDYSNHHYLGSCSAASIPGSNVSHTAGVDGVTSIWVGAAGGMNIRQYTMVPSDSLFIYTKVVITNISALTKYDLYYARKSDLDPDFSSVPSSGISTNQVLEQNGYGMSTRSVVASKGVSSAAEVYMATNDSRAHAASYCTIASSAATIDTTWSGGIPGGIGTYDGLIALTFYSDSLESMDSLVFSFVYVFDAAELDHALTYIESDCHDDRLTHTVYTCDPFVFGGSALSSSGTYYDTIPKSTCGDSIITLNLSISSIGLYSLTTDSSSIFQFPSPFITKAYSYQWYDCFAGAVIPGATGDTFSPPASGMYKLIASGAFCADTTSCVSFISYSSSHFLQGNFVEVGINDAGSYGTENAPPVGYHPNSLIYGLGYVADVGMDGWSSGVIGYCGDYFVPGSPVEGWSIKLNGAYYRNTDLGNVYEIPGHNVATFLGAVEDTSVWQGAIDGLSIRQMTMVPGDSVYFLTRVLLVNSTPDTIHDIYYGRNVDPDNEQPWSTLYQTQNTVQDQPDAVNSLALVSAVGADYFCYLGIGTYDTTAKASRGGFGTNDPYKYYNGIGYVTSVGSTAYTDEAIQLSFHVGDLLPGDSVTLSYVHVMDSAQVFGALLRTGRPCLTSYATYDTVETCDPYTFMGTTYSETGNYAQFLSSVEGCDSSHYLRLVMLGPDTSIFMPMPGALQATESGATYQWYSCDGGFTLIPGATSQVFEPAASGFYAVVINNGLCSDTSGCHSFTMVGAQDPLAAVIKAFPNPVEETLHITVDGAATNVNIEILDLAGKMVLSQCCESASAFKVDMRTLPQGAYLLKVTAGNLILHQRLVKVND